MTGVYGHKNISNRQIGDIFYIMILFDGIVMYALVVDQLVAVVPAV